MNNKTNGAGWNRGKPGGTTLFLAITVVVLLTAYYFTYARLVFSRAYTFGGDTYFYWSFKYLLFYTIKNFNSLPWWDPTMYNGYPLYFHITSAWTNYLGPYTLPSLVIFWIGNRLVDLNINNYIVFHQTIYGYTWNLIAVVLISKELTRNRAAMILAPTIFTFSYFQLLNFHDFYAYEAMTPALFFIYGVIRYNNRRSDNSFLVFLFLTGLLLASLQNGIIMSAFFWTALFVMMLLVFERGIFAACWKNIRSLSCTWPGRMALAVMFILLAAGLISSFLPLYYNYGHLVKYRLTAFGDGEIVTPQPYDMASGITNSLVKFYGSQSWTMIANWLPFPDIHDRLLRFSWDGHENRYIGLVTIPLIVAAFILRARNKYIYILLTSYFLCNAFIIYAPDNIVYKILTDNSDIFRNVTNIGTILPRGGSLLLLIFLAGIGLDALLDRAGDLEAGSAGSVNFELFFKNSILLLVVLSLAMIVCAILAENTGYQWMRHSLFHIAIYLLIFSVITRLLFMSNACVIRTALIFCIYIFAVADLTVSGSAYLLNRHNFPANDTSKHVLIPYGELASTGMTLPDDLQFAPSMSEDRQMFPPNYKGVYHNPWKMMWGIREWLFFATRNEGRRILLNWNQETLRMRSYPVFLLYNTGYFLPFEKIRTLDDDKSPYGAEPLFYLHDQAVVKRGVPPRRINGSFQLSEYTPDRVSMRVRSEEQGMLCYLDNYDRFWTAYVDGKAVPIYRANFTFKAIELPAGEHSVEWRYDPWPVKLLYSLFYGLIILASATLWHCRKQARRIEIA